MTLLYLAGERLNHLETALDVVPTVDLDPAVKALLSAWYEADAGVTLSGDDVTAWADQSGNGRDLSSGTGSPTFLANALNGRPAIVIDGLTSNEFDFVSDSAIFPNLWDASGDGTVVALVKTPTAQEATSDRFIFQSSAANANRLDYEPGADNLRSRTHDGTATRSVSKALTYDAFQIVLLQRDADTTIFAGVDDLDTAALASSATLVGAGGNPAGNLQLGRVSLANATTPFGMIVEILFFDSSLTEASRQKVVDYLEEKYELSTDTTAIDADTVGEDANFPLTDLYDGRPTRPFRFNDDADEVADLSITADLNRVSNSGFETSTLDGWTENNSGDGSTAEDTTNVSTGSKSLKCTVASSGVGERYQDITVRSGERLKLDAGLRGDGTAFARVRIENRHSGNWLQSGGTWSTAADVASRDTASFAASTLQFQVESFDDCGGLFTVTLRIHLRCTDVGDAWFDDVLIYPATNFMSVHGHDLSPVVTPEFHSSDDNFATDDNTEGTFTVVRGSMYVFLSSAIYEQFVRLKLSGTNVDVPWIGEGVVGFAESATTGQRWNWRITHDVPQVRYETSGRETYVHRISNEALRTYRLRFRHFTLADWQEMLEEIWLRTYGGEHPIVMVPYHEDQANGNPVVIHGRQADELDSTRTFIDVHEDELAIRESGLPVIGL